jgi:hypothetical protein
MEMTREWRLVAFITAAIVAGGILGGGLFVGWGFYEGRMADRFVTVKGLAEKDVVADLAVWNMKIAATGDDLAQVQGKIEGDNAALDAFLAASGVAGDEMSSRQVNVTDLMAQQYRSERAEQSRFIVTSSLTVRSTDVDKVRAMSGRAGELIKKGLVLMDDQGPSYIFTKLNEIKPAMIAEATKNARKAAEQFAADSGSSVGGIRRAYQGIFSIEARDGYMGDSNARAIEKKVRVVSTIDYFLN